MHTTDPYYKRKIRIIQDIVQAANQYKTKLVGRSFLYVFENNAIEVRFRRNDFLSDYEWKGKLDLINIVLLGIPEEIPERDEKYTLHRMISVLLSPNLTTDQRMQILGDEYQIEDDKEFREELNEMCNLGEGIYEKGAQKGAHEANVETAKKMIKRNKDTLQDIADLTGLKLEEVEALANMQPA